MRLIIDTYGLKDVHEVLDEMQVRRLEGEGVPSKYAEAITSAIILVLNDNLENVLQSFVSRGEMQKVQDSFFIS
jgi:Protein of unknown function (DUF1640)